MTATGPGWAYLGRRAWRIARRRLHRLRIRPRWQLMAVGAAGLAGHLAGIAAVWLAVLAVGLMAARTMLAMAQSNAVLHSRVQSLEKRHANLSANVTVVAAAGATATTNISSLNSDFSAISGLAGNASFLANLSILPHQTTANATTFSNANFTGLANAVNNLQSGLQGNGFES